MPAPGIDQYTVGEGATDVHTDAIQGFPPPGAVASRLIVAARVAPPWRLPRTVPARRRAGSDPGTGDQAGGIRMRSPCRDCDPGPHIHTTAVRHTGEVPTVTRVAAAASIARGPSIARATADHSRRRSAWLTDRRLQAARRRPVLAVDALVETV